MAPVPGQSSQLIVEKVQVAGIKVGALVDTGATASCCRYDWYKRNRKRLGPLIASNRTVIGVGNIPIKVQGLTKPINVKWAGVTGRCQFTVFPRYKAWT